MGTAGLVRRFQALLLAWLERARIRFLCLGILVVSLVFLAVSFATADRGTTFFGPPLGADFAGLYTGGLILDQESPEDRDRLYDFDYHDLLYHQLLPRIQEEDKLPFVYPPFMALLFAALARLPYEGAVVAWLILSAGLYLAGLALLWQTRLTLPATDRTTVWLLALSFEPFVMECWLGGQTAAFGFFFLALAFACDPARRPFAAGLALGLCLYKPTLLVLLLPMMVVARRFRVLAGFGLTALVLACVSFVGAGRKNCLDYAGKLLGFARTTTGAGAGPAGRLELRLWKYVDLNSFFRQLLGSSSALNWVLIALVGVGPLVLLLVCWWRLPRQEEGRRRMVWAATLTWSLVLNLYAGIYDTVLAVPAAFWTADVLRRDGPPAPGTRAGSFASLLVLLFLVPWATQPLARATGLQVFTLVLMAVGAFQLHGALQPTVPAENRPKHFPSPSAVTE